MYYYASLNSKGVCCDVSEYEEEQQTNAYCVQLDSLDTSLVFRKKYVDGEWVDCLPSETDLPMSDRLGYSPTDEWLSDVLGNITNLSTTDKTSLVAAVNECFQFASDGKTAIANAITGIDESITIPDNATFEQLAAFIGQFFKVTTGTFADSTKPSSVEITTGFQPRAILAFNNYSTVALTNIFLFVHKDLVGASSHYNANIYGSGSTLTRRASVFTLSETGFALNNVGDTASMYWIAIK